MAKSTGIDEIINFCEIIDEMDAFEDPNYKLLSKVLKSDNYDTSFISSKSIINIPLFPIKQLMIRNRLG